MPWSQMRFWEAGRVKILGLKEDRVQKTYIKNSLQSEEQARQSGQVWEAKYRQIPDTWNPWHLVGATVEALGGAEIMKLLLEF